MASDVKDETRTRSSYSGRLRRQSRIEVVEKLSRY